MNLIRSLNPMQRLFIKHGRWRRFYRKYHLSMRRAIVENVVRMLSCVRKIRGVSLYQCPNLLCQIRSWCLLPARAGFALPAGKNLLTNGSKHRRRFFPTAPGNTLPSPCPVNFGNYSAITGTCSTNFQNSLPTLSLKLPENRALFPAFSLYSTLLVATSNGTYISTFPLHEVA